ncbi:hypothetical protein MRB53_020710 [Persea americana]|uniref:Uncharacterized protein n=1 Tax=Persea americana TaxID=3435 RepID=A0ACC2L313_PERAE|nr:hypothetical protein MRB53_020710 [Persea americana]
MENNQGDLADILRVSGGSGGGSMYNPSIDWQFQSEPLDLLSGIEELNDGFGDPFLDMHDPLSHQGLDMVGPEFFDGSDSTGPVKMNTEGDDSIPSQIMGEEMKGPCNIFSRVLQISPNAKMPIFQHNSNPSPVVASPRRIKPPSLEANEIIKSNNGSCLLEVQMPPPRNPGIKRRKNQTKKVVCIPAPAVANNRSSAEVVPSDHWAWRKYGQKPIKGSPYPRGYYRCSSSKGCSARKQVERSRNDPKMLVITYTSEHNHPWPTQRNALAGSTRTQPLKKDAASKNSPITPIPKRINSKEEPKKIEIHKDNRSTVALGGSSSTTPGSVKEEIEKAEKPMMGTTDRKFDQDFSHQSYGLVQLDSNQSDDFFADLGELEPDSLGIMFSEGFTGRKLKEDRGNKPMDPFSSLFACSGNSFGEAGKGL